MRAMRNIRVQAALAVLSLMFPQVSSFLTARRTFQREKATWLGAADDILECATIGDPTDRLKRELLQLGASYDRGFGASQRAREEVMKVIEELEQCNVQTNAANGIEGGSDAPVSPLQGQWRMIWTSAVDVLLLQASPLFTAGAIYQVFEPPVVTNIIDFIPRAQSLFPPDTIPNSLIRAQVQTKANQREPNRVGLVFEKVKLQPLQVLGQSVDVFPPLGFNLPKLPGTGDDGPGYFDVSYLDQDFLVVRQNAPGGTFVLLKVDSIEA